MPLIGNQLASAENNSFRVLDDISNFTLTFNGSSSSVVSVANNLFTLPQHPFVTGQRVTYSSGAGTTIGGLISGSVYYIIKLDQNTFRLSTTYAGSLQNTNIVSLVNTGTGITHSFNVAFDGINTKFKATFNNGTKCSISRAAQLDVAINGVVQQPYDSNPPPNGFTIEADSTIVFSAAPLAGFTFWGKALTNAIASFETSDNSIDNFTGNGVLKNFTLSKTPANSQNVLVTINGVLQYPSDSTTTRSYSVNANVLVFDAAPANGSSIQVRYIGFAGATSSNVTGFYGRTGNVVLTSTDGIGVGTAKIGTGAVGVATALLVEGNARITGILTVGTSSITFDGRNDQIRVGPSFISATSVGLGTTTTAGRNAGINTSVGTVVYNSTVNEVQVYRGNNLGWSNIGESIIDATGGIISDYTSGNFVYRAHVFTSSGTFTVNSPAPATVEYLVVAGGGAGGGAYAGGGGAGGFRSGSGLVLGPGSYPVIVGSGAVGAEPGNNQGPDGSPSVFFTITATGGGGGGRWNPTGGFSGSPGGSGGGAGGRDGTGVSGYGGLGNTPPFLPPQGNPGGKGGGGPATGGSGGGGGAGGQGTDGNPTGTANGYPGGPGATSSITGQSTTYAGGGGGGAGQPGGTGGSGGPGGGGAGAPSGTSVPGSNGTYATGGGGGGTSGNGNGYLQTGRGGNGGSGIIVLRYIISSLAATAKATGGFISYSGGKTIHTFYTSGTFTVTNPSLTSVDYLVVAGGGGGGGAGSSNSGTGGGGAGGFRTGTGQPVTSSPGIYAITVGAGGAGGGAFDRSGSPIIDAGKGGNSSIAFPSTITSEGGGASSNSNSIAPSTAPSIKNGGSGSGGTGAPGLPTGVQPGYFGAGNTPPTSPPQGNPGGTAAYGPVYYSGGGGGGAGAAGGNAPNSAYTAGAGGDGLISSISGTSTYYAGGGGGGAYNSNTFASGGLGGGGRGGGDGTTPGSDASQSTGGGGGGTAGGTTPPTSNRYGGSGGSGIVIISYPS